MLPVGAILVDFDGTACTADVSELLLSTFAPQGWEEENERVRRGEIGLREAARRQISTLQGSRDALVEIALAGAPLDPTFPGFVRWVEGRGIPLQIVSDGFGFYVAPILEAAGLGRVDVLTNETEFGAGPPRLRHPHGHPTCVGCGTCKMLATQRARERHGTVAFVGEGLSDRYGALYADLVFAKDALRDLCTNDGVPFVEWETFDDVRTALEGVAELPGPVAPEVCPGWTLP